MRLDTVVFDIGGVLVDWDPRHLYRSMFDGDHAEMERFLDEVCTNEWNHAMDAGRPFAEASAELIGRYPQYEGQILAWQGRWTEMLSGSIEGTVEVLRELAEAQGPRVRVGFEETFEGRPDIVLRGAEPEKLAEGVLPLVEKLAGKAQWSVLKRFGPRGSDSVELRSCPP